MLNNRLKNGLGRTLLLVCTTGLLACPAPEAPWPDKHYFSIKIAEGGVSNKRAISKFEIRIGQLDKAGAIAGGYDFDLFKGLAAGASTYRGVGVNIKVVPTTGPGQYSELVFTFDGNPFTGNNTDGEFPVAHLPWAGWNTTTNVMDRAPPAFNIKLSAWSRYPISGLEVLVGTSGTVANPWVLQPPGVIFNGPKPDHTWPVTNTQTLTCALTGDASWCQTQEPDAGPPPPPGPDAGVDAGQGPDEYQLTNYKLNGAYVPGSTGVAQVTESQSGLTLEVTVVNRDFGDITRVVPKLQIAKITNGVIGAYQGDTELGFELVPREALAGTTERPILIDRSTQKTFSFDLNIKPTAPPDGGAAATMNPAAAGQYSLRLRLEASAKVSGGDIQPDGGGVAPIVERLLNFVPTAIPGDAAHPGFPILPLTVDARPTIVFTTGGGVTEPITVSGTNDVYQGDRRDVKIALTNPARRDPSDNTKTLPTSTIKNLAVTYAIRLLNDDGSVSDSAPPGVFLDLQPNLGAGPDGAPIDTTTLKAGDTLYFSYTLRVEDEAPPNKKIRIVFTATGKDENLEQSDPITTVSPNKDLQLKGSSRVVITQTIANYTTVFLGQGKMANAMATVPANIVKITMTMQNEGYDAAKITAPGRMGFNEPRIRFISRNNQELRVAKITDDDAQKSTAAWVQVKVSPDPSTIVLQPGNGQPGPAQTLEFWYYCVDRDNGQLGNNTLQAGVDYIGVARDRTGSVTETSRPWPLNVIFTPGPELAPPQAERDSDYGAAISRLNYITFQNQTWPGVAIGAPSATQGSGSVYFWQFVTSGETGATTNREISRTQGLANARFGTAVSLLGNWDRSNSVDRSNEVAIGRPGQSLFTLFSLAQNAPVQETLPSDFVACANCDLGAALAANPRGLREPFDSRSNTPIAGLEVNKLNRRLFALGAPKAGSPRPNLGRIDVFWQRLFSEGGNGSLSYRRVDGETDGERFGAALAIADVDGDGDPDIIVGSPGFRRDGDTADRGRIRVLRGPEYLRFAPKYTYLEGETAGEKFGSTIINVGDIDGDGADDLAIGAPEYSQDGKPQIGRVYVLSGATGQRIYTLEGQVWNTAAGAVGERFGTALAPLFTLNEPSQPNSDFNKDGRPDFAVGAPFASPGGRDAAGSAYVYSAPKVGDAPGKLLLRFDGQSAGDQFGTAVAGGGDLNNDGYHDLLVGAPKYVTPGDTNAIKRGRVYVYYGAAFEPFQDPARADVLAINDGATGTPAVRTVTIPKPGALSQVPLNMVIRNGGDRSLDNFAASLLIRRKNADNTYADVPFTTTGCTGSQAIDNPNLARVCTDGAYVELKESDPAYATGMACPFAATKKCSRTTSFPTSIGPGMRVQIQFITTISDAARPEEWQISAMLPGIGDAPPKELDATLRRTWRLQQYPNLQVLGILTVDGNTDLGFTSINRGADVEISATIVNTGEATVTGLEATLKIDAGRTGGDPRVMVYSPKPLSTRTLAKNDRVEAHFILSVDDRTVRNTTTNLDELIRVIAGQEFLVTVLAQGQDANTQGTVDTHEQAPDPLRVVASRAKLRVRRVAVPTTASRFVVPDQRNVPFETDIVYDSDAPITGFGASLRVQNIGLRFSVAPDQWVVRADTQGRTIGICDAANPNCNGETFSVTADVPTIIAPGPVTVQGTVQAIDEEATDSGVIVRGFSNPAVDTLSSTQIQVLGVGTKLVEITRTDAPGFGAAVAYLGDLNNDGRGDFAVAAPAFEGRGKVFFFDGRLSALADGAGTQLGDFLGDVNRRFYGQILAGGYNLNGSATDKTPDLVVGSPAAADGAYPLAQPLFMSTNTGTPGPSLPASLQPPAGRSPGDRAGSAIAVGDVNNDGCPDIITGIPGAQDLSPAGATRARTGGVCVKFGTTSFDGTRSCAIPPECGATGEICWSEGAEGDEFGAAVAAWMPAGNARFYLAVGAPGTDLQTPDGLKPDVGKIYIYPDVTCGATKPISISMDANNSPLATDKAVANAHFGAALAATRLVTLQTPDNNPPEKLIIGAPGIRSCEIPNSVCPDGTACSGNVCQPLVCGDDSVCGAGAKCVSGKCDRITLGRAYVLSDSPDQNHLQVAATGEKPGDRFGAVVAAVGDIDGDNVGDIGIGAPGAQFGALQNGRAQVLSGAGFFTLFQFGTPSNSVQNVGRSISGAGRLNDDVSNDVLIGADGKVFLAAGLERPTAASLRIDSVTAGVREVSTGQQDVPVIVRITNIGRADAFLRVPTTAQPLLQPQLIFKAAVPGTQTAADGTDPNYTVTQVSRLNIDGDPTKEEVLGSTNLTETDCTKNRRCVPSGSQAMFKLKVAVGSAQQGTTSIDARVDAQSNAPTGPSISAQSADLTDSWSVKTPPNIEILSVTSSQTVVFQGQKDVPVAVALRNNQPSSKPTRVEVRLKFKDVATGTDVPAGFAFVQLPAAEQVAIAARACTTNTQCGTESCAPDGFCTVTNPQTTVTVKVSLAADAKLGEQELTADVLAPPMPNAAVGPADVSKRQHWTVLPAGVPDVLSVSFRRPCAAATECGTGGQCTDGFCAFGPDSVTLSAGQQAIAMTVKVKNAGSLMLREVVPAIYFPLTGWTPTNRVGFERSDLPRPTLAADQTTVIAPGETAEMTFRLDIPPVAVLNRNGFGKVTVDAQATGRDSNHAVEQLSARQNAQFTLQRPAAPLVEQVQLQGLIYRGEPKVKLAVTISNGTVATACSATAPCTAAGATCVNGFCSPGPDPTAAWSGITPSLCFQWATTVPPPGSTTACTYTAQLRAQGDGTPQAAQNPTEVAGNSRVQMLYEFDSPAEPPPPLGNTRVRLVYQGKDKNTGLAIADVVYDRVTFLMNRDNLAGEQLVPAIAAPDGAIRFGASIAAAKVSDDRKGIFVVGAPESDPVDPGPKGRVYIYGRQTAPTGSTIAQLSMLTGEAQGDRFGDSVAILRNPDGTARYIAVAAPGRSEQGVTAGGVVYFYDAQTYSLVYQRSGFEDNLRMGKIKAAGNLDADTSNAEDLVVGLSDYNNGNGRVIMLSGKPPFDVIGAPIDGPATSSFGTGLSGALPTGVGTNVGFLVGAPSPTGTGLTGLVRAYSSAGSAGGINVTCTENGAARNLSIPASAAWGGRQNLFGTAIAVTDSIDTDTCPDILIGAPGEDVGILERAGAVYVARSVDGYFPSTPTTIRQSRRPNASFGAAIVSVGDWNGDGKPEFAVGAPTAPVGGIGTDGYPVTSSGVGAVTVYLGDRNLSFYRVEGKRDSTPEGVADQNFGATLAAVDLNEDGILDLVVGAPGSAGGGSNGRVYVFQGGQQAGAMLRVNTVTTNGVATAARGVPVAPWQGLQVQVAVTNAGRSTAQGVTPVLSFIGRNGQPVTGLTVRQVAPCCDDRNGACTCSAPTQAFPKDVPAESSTTWTFSVDVSSVATPQQYSILSSLSAKDALTGKAITINSNSVPTFVDVVQRNYMLATLAGVVPATDQNPQGFGSGVTAIDVNGDGFKDLVVADPRADRQDFGKVHVYSGRNFARRLISIDAPSGEGRNYNFGSDVASAVVGAASGIPGTPMVFVSQLDQSDPNQPAPNCGTQSLPGGIFAFPLDCSASTCAVLPRVPAGDRSWRALGLCSDNLGSGMAWLGADRINGTDGEYLAVTNDPDTGGVLVFDVAKTGIKLGQRIDLDPNVADAAPAANRHCGGTIASRRKGEAGAANAQFAVRCNDLDQPGDTGVRVYTPATGQWTDYLRRLNNNPPPARQENAPFGESIALLADMNGDGIGEVLIGWPKYSTSYQTPSQIQSVGRVEIWAGANATPPYLTPPYVVIESSTPAAQNQLGASVANVGDVDGDGVSDFAISIPGQRTVRVYSGLSTDSFKRILMTIVAPQTDAYIGFGAKVVGVGDVNGDGFMDIAVSAPGAIVGGSAGTTTTDADGGTTTTGGATGTRGAVYVFSGGNP